MKALRIACPVKERKHKRMAVLSLARKIGIRLILALPLLLLVVSSYAQQQGAQQKTESRPPSNPRNVKVVPAPLSHVYANFLLLQNHLDRTAAARESQGKDASLVRNYFQDRLGLSAPRFTVVRGTGLRLEAELKQLNAEAMVIIEEHRKARLENSNQPTEFVPDPRLLDLNKQREALIQREVDQLNRELGPSDAQKLKAFLETQARSKPLPNIDRQAQASSLPARRQSQPVHP